MATPYQPAGYGKTKLYSPPEGRWEQEPGLVVAGDDLVSTASWSDLLKSGYSVVYHLTIDGIPYVFTDRDLWDVYGREMRAPADYTIVPALFIDDQVEISIDCDRQTGLAAGRAVDFVLSWQVLEDLEIAPILFAETLLRAALTADVSDAAATTFTVDSTSGFVAGTGYYVGHEYIVPSGLTTTSFEGVRRGVCGRPHYHASGTSSGYRYVTTAPTYWRGRLVTLYEMIVSPDGRALGGTLATVGSWCRQIWKGYLDAEPKPGDAGMVLTALPLVRLLAEELGAKLSGAVNFDLSGFPYPLVFDGADVLRVQEEAAAGVDEIGPNDPAELGIGSLAAWCAKAQADIQADIGTDRISVVAKPNQWLIRVTMQFAAATDHEFHVWSNLWCTNIGQREGLGSVAAAWADIPLNFNYQYGWIPIRFEANEDGSSADVPSSGLGVLEVEGVRETVRWDSIRQMLGADGSIIDPDVVALRVVERNVGSDAPQALVDWSGGAKFTVVSGFEGYWGEVFRTLVTSSGLGVRGTYDTLGLAFGLGLDESDLDVASLVVPFGVKFPYTADGKASIADLMCGWMALVRKCIVQKRMPDGYVRLCAVSTETTDDSYAATLSSADVLMGGHKVPEKTQAPNTIVIDASSGGAQSKIIVRDRARSQAEKGAKSWDIKAPGCSVVDATRYGLSLQRLADGQATLELEVPCYTDLVLGDGVKLTTAHPLVYDWRTGTRAPASINARVVGEASRLVGNKRMTLLLAGLAGQTQLLCPAPKVTSVMPAAYSVRIANEEADWFAAGDLVYLYNPGTESTEAASYTITTITTGATETVLTFSGAIGSWVTTGTTRVTFPTYGTGDVTQSSFVYYRADRYWR